MQGYLFEQSPSGSECSVCIDLGPGLTKRDVLVNVKSNSVELGTKQRPGIIQGELFARVSASASLWVIDKQGMITLHLEKKEQAYWPALIRGPTPDTNKLDPHSAFVCAEMFEAQILTPTTPEDFYSGGGGSGGSGGSGGDALTTSLALLERACSESHIPSMMKLSAIYSPEYQPKYPVEPSFDKRVMYLTMAADAGFMEAMIVLAMLYSDTTDGHVRDTAAAIHWYRQAAQVGRERQLAVSNPYPHRMAEAARAMYALATLLAEPGPHQDLKESVMWLEAASPFSAAAAYQLGVCYMTAHGCKQNFPEALRAFTLAKSLDPTVTVPNMEALGRAAASQAIDAGIKRGGSSSSGRGANNNNTSVSRTMAAALVIGAAAVGAAVLWKRFGGRS